MVSQPPENDKATKLPKERKLTREELLVWNYVTQQDKRLPHADIEWQQITGAQDKSALKPIPEKADCIPLETMVRPIPFSEAGQAHAPTPTIGGLDRNSARRLRQGKFAIEATLDLHGMTREEAWNSLTGFLNRAFEHQKRCVLVITGKGRFRAESGSNEGILRNQLPRWLALPPCVHWVLRHHRAQPQHGGEGAFYILLRRKR